MLKIVSSALLAKLKETLNKLMLDLLDSMILYSIKFCWFYKKDMF